MHQATTFAESIPFYMTHNSGLHGGAVGLLRLSQERHAKHLKQEAVRAELAKQTLAQALAAKNMRTGVDRRSIEAPRFATLQDMLNFQERRHGERRARGDATPSYSPLPA